MMKRDIAENENKKYFCVSKNLISKYLNQKIFQKLIILFYFIIQKDHVTDRIHYYTVYVVFDKIFERILEFNNIS